MTRHHDALSMIREGFEMLGFEVESVPPGDYGYVGGIYLKKGDHVLLALHMREDEVEEKPVTSIRMRGAPVNKDLEAELLIAARWRGKEDPTP